MSEEIAVNDEIDLKELVKSVLATRVWVGVLLVILSVGYWAFVAGIGLVKPQTYSYETRINFTFKGAAEGLYPNGAAFDINQIIAPVILSQAFELNDLDQFIALKDFSGSFSISPYTPDRELIMAKYRSQLDAKNLSIAETSALQKQLTDELQNAASDSASLRFSGGRIGKIPETVARKMLIDVPRLWAKHMVEVVGVSKFDITLYSSKVIDEALLEEVDYLIAFEVLFDRLRLLDSNVSALKSLSNGRVVTDQVTGMTITDLSTSIDDVRRYRVAPLINPIRSLGLTKDREVVQLYFDYELIDLERKLKILESRDRNLQAAYSRYVNLIPEQDKGVSVAPSSTLMPQFGGEFIDKIVELTNYGEDIQYRQSLNSQLLAVTDEIASLKAEIERIREVQEVIKHNGAKDLAMREQLASVVSKDMPKVLEALKEKFEISERIYESVSREQLGDEEQLFKVADGDKSIRTIDYNILTFRNFRTYLILCFLLIVVAVPVLMVRNSMRKTE